MIQYLEKLILDNWEKWLGNIKPKRLDFLKTHAGQAIRNKKVGFFAFNNDKPVIFVKTVRESKYNKIIEHSFGKLKNIYKYLDNGSVPKPIYLGNHQGVVFSLETAILGKQFHSYKKQRDLKKFLKWFFRFQRLMIQKEKIANIQLKDYIDELVNKFLNLYKIERDLREPIKYLAGELKKDIDDLSSPLISQHGDLTPDNVLNDKGKIKVIDWDNFEKIKLPLFDLLVFLQRWSGIRDVSFVPKYLAIIEKYLKEFNIDKRALKLLVFCYYLLDSIRKKQALTDYDKKYLRVRLREIKKL